MMFYLSPLVIYIPVGIYLFYFFRRFLKLFVSKDEKLLTNLCSILFAVLCTVAGWRVYGLGAVIILHFTVVMIFLEGVNQIVKHVLVLSKVSGNIMFFILKCDILYNRLLMLWRYHIWMNLLNF